MKVHYPKLHNMAHILSLNVFTASKGSNNYILFINLCILHGHVFVMVSAVLAEIHVETCTEETDQACMIVI